MCLTSCLLLWVTKMLNTLRSAKHLWVFKDQPTWRINRSYEVTDHDCTTPTPHFQATNTAKSSQQHAWHHLVICGRHVMRMKVLIPLHEVVENQDRQGKCSRCYTGSIAYAALPDGSCGRAAGCGPAFLDGGCGYDIGQGPIRTLYTNSTQCFLPPNSPLSCSCLCQSNHNIICRLCHGVSL